jgi:predicted nuclease of predicted toxin-antitoxin system
MKLLFDQNLSPKLPACLSNLFPGSKHVLDVGLDQSDDHVIWGYARANDFAIVTKDIDYPNLVALRGHPPKVIWLQLGNCTTKQAENALRADYAAIVACENDSSVGTVAVK